jgi:mono/diheme cytochrome c family protein
MKRSVLFAPLLALALASCAERSVSLSPATTAGPAFTQRLRQEPRQRSEDETPGSLSPHARTLFLKNCAHCHGADAHGDEGPDLHNLDESDTWIANRIRNGKKGQMTAFAGKLKEEEIAEVIEYLRGLK